MPLRIFVALDMASSIIFTASSLISASSAGTACSTLSTSASACAIFSSSLACTSSSLANFSAEATAWRCLPSFSLAVFKRSLIFFSAPTESPPLGSRCFAARILLASVHAAPAAFSAGLALSMVSLIVSKLLSSTLSAASTLAMSSSASTAFSAAIMLSTVSASIAFSFLSAVSLRKLTILASAASVRRTSGVSWSVIESATSFVNFFASPSFAFRNALVWFSAWNDSAPAFSDAPMAWSDSSFGNTSMPLRNGISASWHLESSDSTCRTFSRAASSDDCTESACFCPFCLALTASSFVRSSAPRFRKTSNSESVAGSAPFVRWFIVCMDEFKAFRAEDNNLSAESISSWDISPTSRPLHMLDTSSIWGSAALRFSTISPRALWAATHAGYSFLNALYLFSFFCTSPNFACNEASSFTASFFASPVYLRAAVSLVPRSLRTSASFFCAASADASIFSSCLFKASPGSGGLVINVAACVDNFSTSVSLLAVSAFTLGMYALKSLASFSPCACCFFSSSFFFCSFCAFT
mmetsp:Transcript_62731/g.174788  ORF Transcript_62731/g.174788 Transcript_62731/m.174788 type:complete len:527 (+) Transcript_62731:614-2194(+)